MCCDFYCLNELSEYLKMETGLCSAVLIVVVVVAVKLFLEV